MMVRDICVRGFVSLVVASLGLAAESTLAQSPATTDRGSDAGLTEVVVTATRTAEVLSKVPVSVQAVTNAQLEAAGVREVTDLVRLTPGVQITGNAVGVGGGDVAIRGIHSNAGASTTGIYVDDTPIQVVNTYLTAGELFPASFDMERVEVLRGPQGTLFGAGSEGGTLRFIQTPPSLTQYSGQVRVEGSNTEKHSGSHEAGFAYGGPIIEDRLGFRVNAYYRLDGGYIDFGPFESATVNTRNGSAGPLDSARMVPNAAGLQKGANWVTTKSFRAALKFQPAESLTVTPSWYYQRKDQGYPNNSFAMAGSDPDSSFFYNPQYIPGPATPGGFSQLHLPTSLSRNNQLSVGSLDIQWNFGPATLTSTTSLVRTALTALTDTTQYYSVYQHGIPGQRFPLPGQFSPTYTRATSEAFTQEFRLAGTTERLNWQLGAFFSRVKQREFEYEENNVSANATYFYGFPDAVAGGPPFGPGYSAFENYYGVPLLEDSGTYYGDSHTNDRQIAVFAQADFKITSILSVTAGLRYATDRLSFSLFGPGSENNINPPYGADCPTGPVCPFGSGVFAPSYPGGSQSTTARPFNPKIALNAQLTDNNLVYASATKGFRIGGAQLPNPTGCDDDLRVLGYVDASGKPFTPPSYKPDFVWSYELGTKNSLSGGKVTLNGSVYMIKWKDIQTSISLPGCGYAVTANTGAATIKGFDIDAAFAPIRGLQFRVDLGYFKTSLDDGLYQPSGAAVYTRGSAIPGSGAPFNVVVSGRYEFPLAGEVRGYVYADGRHDSNLPRTGRTDPSVYNYLPFQPVDPWYNTADFRLGLMKESFDVSLFVNNAFDSRPLFITQQSRSSQRYLFTGSTIRPRTYGITAALKF